VTQEPVDHTVPDSLGGARIDVAVSRLTNLSRGVVRRLIDAGAVTVNATGPRPSDRVRVGDVISILISDDADRLIPDPSVPFDVLYEDAALLIVDKPPGVVVHAGAGSSESTLVHGLMSRFPDVEGVGQEHRWGIVHRLDRETSGLLVVARTNDSYLALVDMIRQRLVTRRYLAVVSGTFANATGKVDAPISRDPRNRTRMTVRADGRPAVSHYRRLATWREDGRSLLSVTLETGRTHQIRVHMRAIDHGIIGDPAYGRPGGVGDPGRPWLHARQLRFEHPESGSVIDVASPLPRDLSDSLGRLGESDEGSTLDVDGVEL
jgi:23S rRNA pseudouridine1911/1915/1917 synthase